MSDVDRSRTELRTALTDAVRAVEGVSAVYPENLFRSVRGAFGERDASVAVSEGEGGGATGGLAVVIAVDGRPAREVASEVGDALLSRAGELRDGWRPRVEVTVGSVGPA